MEQCWQHDAAMRPSFTQILQDLDRVIVDAAITDPVGKRFWLEYFPNRDRVPWDDFLIAFYSLLDFYHDTTYIPLEPFPTRDKIQIANEFQLNEYASRGGEQQNTVSEERSRRMRTHNFEFFIEDTMMLCLKEVLLEDTDDEIVTMAKFGNMLLWFGPIVNNATEPRIILLQTLYDTLSKEYILFIFFFIYLLNN